MLVGVAGRVALWQLAILVTLADVSARATAAAVLLLGLTVIRVRGRWLDA